MSQCPVIKETNTVKGADYAFLGEATTAEEIVIPADSLTAARYLPLLILLLACCYAGSTTSIMGNNSTPILMAIFCMFEGSFECLHNVQRSLGKLLILIPVLIVVIGCAANVHGAGQHNNTAAVSDQCFLNSSNDIQQDFEWCCDSGTNRFVTNDSNDFLPGTIKTVPTIVAVGGGKVTSPCSGTVIVESLDYGWTIQCDNVLFIPECGK